MEFQIRVSDQVLKDLIRLLNEGQKAVGLDATEAAYGVIQALKAATPVTTPEPAADPQPAVPTD